MSLRVAALLDGVFVAGVMDPRKTDDAHFERVEAVLQTGKLKALKAYLGYLHFGPEHPNYRRYYALAARYQLPVVFHTGDTYALKAKVKYAHPLRVDEVAVDYPGVLFVMAHMGCPWLDTAAEVIYKNDNVWADVSGLFVGDEAYQQRIKANGFLDAFAERLRYAVLYTEKPEKFLYGSDWPLAPMQAYHASVMDAGLDELIPGLFHDNARALFNLP